MTGQIQGILDTLLPPCCMLCGMSSSSDCLCAACKSELPWQGISCSGCGLPLASVHDSVCGTCLKTRPPFTLTVTPLRYEFPADRLVQALKFKRQLVAGRILAQLMCENIMTKGVQLPDMLIPVPLHAFRLLRRGFNQAYEIASHASRSLGIQLVAGELRRRRNTSAQSGLSRKQRRKNVRNAFFWRGHQKPGRHVALVDDVMTTGTTVTECTRVLKRAGAKRVDIWVATRAISTTHR